MDHERYPGTQQLRHRLDNVTTQTAEQQAMPASCPRCGNYYLPDAVYCRHCGERRQDAGVDYPVETPEGSYVAAQPSAFHSHVITGPGAEPPEVTGAFNLVDKNHDGVISREEFQEALRNKLLQQLGMGRASAASAQGDAAQPPPAPVRIMSAEPVRPMPGHAQAHFTTVAGGMAAERVDPPVLHHVVEPHFQQPAMEPMTGASMTAPAISGRKVPAGCPTAPPVQMFQPHGPHVPPVQIVQTQKPIAQAATGHAMPLMMAPGQPVPPQTGPNSQPMPPIIAPGRPVAPGQPMPSGPIIAPGMPVLPQSAPVIAPGMPVPPQSAPVIAPGMPVPPQLATPPPTQQHQLPSAQPMPAPIQLKLPAPQEPAAQPLQLALQRPATTMPGAAMPGAVVPQGVNPLQLMFQQQQAQSQQMQEMKSEMTELKKMFMATMQMQQQQMQTQQVGQEPQYQSPYRAPDGSLAHPLNASRLGVVDADVTVPTPVQPAATPMQPLPESSRVLETPVQAIDRSVIAGPASSANCPQCGNIYAPDATFCRRCGHQRELDQLAVLASRKGGKRKVQESCHNCGNIFASDSMFCRRCGQQRPHAPNTYVVADYAQASDPDREARLHDVQQQLYAGLPDAYGVDQHDLSGSGLGHVDYNAGVSPERGQVYLHDPVLDSRLPVDQQTADFLPAGQRDPDPRQSMEFAPANSRSYGSTDPGPQLDPFLASRILDPRPQAAQNANGDLMLPLGSSHRRTASSGTLPPGEDRLPDPMQSMEWIPNQRPPSSNYQPREVVFTPGGGNLRDDSPLLPVLGQTPIQQSRGSVPPARASGSFTFIKKDWNMNDQYVPNETNSNREFHHESISGLAIPELPVAKEDHRGDYCSVM